MLPAGRLREWPNNRKRADIIIVTKCPQNIKGDEMGRIVKQLSTSAEQKVFFSYIKYGVPYLMGGNSTLNLENLNRDDSIILLAGIASPVQIQNYIRQYSNNIELLEYGDHHNFSVSDLNRLEETVSKCCSKNRYIITTEKDAARLNSMNLADHIRQNIYVLPIEAAFIKDGTIFDNCIIEHLNR